MRMTLFADRRAIKQIVINLLSNAVKFTGQGGHISVRARNASGALMLTIEDNGCGIPKAALGKLGRPFEQVQNQFSKNHAGSGLGLAISRSLAELHGGALKIRSTEGVGTIVSVRIPVQAPASRRMAAIEARRRQDRSMRQPGPLSLRRASAGRKCCRTVARCFLEVRFQHAEIRQVGCRQQQVGKPGRDVVRGRTAPVRQSRVIWRQRPDRAHRRRRVPAASARRRSPVRGATGFPPCR